MNWGSVLDWVAAIGTVGSLFVALKLLKGEINERRRHDMEKENEQARRVTAWNQSNDQSFILHAKNAGTEPVYKTNIWLSLPLIDQSSAEAYMIGSSNHAPLMLEGYEEWYCGVLPPGETIKKDVPKDLKGKYQDFPEVEIRFTDANGKHWVRHQDGALVQIDDRSDMDYVGPIRYKK